MNHIWAQISYSSPHEAHQKNKRVVFVEKDEKCGEIAKWNHKLLAENLHERPSIQNIQ